MSHLLRALLKSLGILCLMVTSGTVCFFVFLLVFSLVGETYFGGYDYFGRFPALLLTPAVVGFFAPLMTLWWVEKKGAQGRRTLLKTARIAVLVLLIPVILFCIYGFWTTFEPFDHAIQIRARIGYGGIGLVCSAAVVWLLVRRNKN